MNTTSKGFKKPLKTEAYDVTVQNDNMDLANELIVNMELDIAAKETPAGAQIKANNAETNAKNHSNGLIGSLASLLTSAKNNIVAAINEIKNALDTHLAEDTSTTKKGHVQLTDSVTSTSITTAATPKNVKAAYDLANAAIPKSLGTAANDFLVASGAGAWVKKTLAEIRTLLSCLLTTGGTMSGEINHADNLVTRAYLKDYAEAVTVNAASTGTVTLNIELANNFNLTIASATTLVFSNPSASGRVCSITVKINMPATLYAITFPASVKWDGDKIPTFSASKTAILTFVTFDAGARWYGMAAGTNFTT